MQAAAIAALTLSEDGDDATSAGVFPGSAGAFANGILDRTAGTGLVGGTQAGASVGASRRRSCSSSAIRKRVRLRPCMSRLVTKAP